MNTPFVHLRSHTEYSIVESTLRIDDLILKAQQSGQPAVAMTDVDNMFGAIRFYTAAKSAGVKAIIGVDSQIQGELVTNEDGTTSFAPAHRVLLLSKNFEGYKKLMELISRGYTTNMINGTPTIKEEWLQELGTDGLICLSGDENSALAQKLMSEAPQTAVPFAKKYAQLFPGNYYIELQRRGTPKEADYIHKSVALADSLSIPLVATHPMQFAERTDYIAHELKVCDKTKQILHDRARERKYTPEQFVYPTNYMQELFKDIPDALANTYAIAQQSNLDIPLGKNVLPPFPTPEGVSLEELFIKNANQGLQERLIALYPDEQKRAQKQAEYQKRLDYEIEIILKMGFDGYFMIVSDFINWSKTNGIPVGPGRGSGAGSLVAYSLRITDVDPLQYNLLFERFLNPERVSMPDFDIDFCQLRRELVVRYVTEKYGEQSVAGICNITTLGAKNAVKAAGRALGIPLPAVDRISKMIPSIPGKEVHIKDILKDPNFSELQEAYEEQPQVKKLLDSALRLEGLPHSIGQHAAGIVMSPSKISDFSPLYIPKGKMMAVTQYDKDDIEKAGLVKFDFLGLKTLTEIDYAVKTIQNDLGNPDFSIDKIPLDDQKTLESFQKGDTLSVFQFESEGMRKMLKESHPDRFEELAAMNALYRPGPMDLIPSFNRRKHGEEPVQYADPRIEPILSETYGIMVYQEQVMQIAQVLGGYTLGGADILRKAMGKKKPEEMAKHRQIFVQGAVKNGLSEEKATKLYDDMEKFAGYGFNKSHAVAYSLLAFQTAYIKQHYPTAFYSSFLTVEGDEDTDVIPGLIEDAKRHNVTVLPPDINKSRTSFTPETLSNGQKSLDTIRYGISALKGIGKDLAGKIEVERARSGPFQDLPDFCKRMGKTVNTKALEILIKSGSFDSIHPNRAQCLEYAPLILKYLDEFNKAQAKELKSKSEGAMNVLKTVARKTVAKKAKVSSEDLPVPECPQTPDQDTLSKCLGEKMAFGFFFTDNPYNYYKQQLGGLSGALPLDEVSQLYPSKDQHWVTGIVTDIRTIITGRGKMGIISITDGDHVQEIKAFSDVFEPMQKQIKTDKFILAAVNAKEDKFAPTGVGLIASELKDLPAIKKFLVSTVNIALPLQEDKMSQLQAIVSQHPGSVPITLWIPQNNTYAKVENQTPISCSASEECLQKLTEEFGEKYTKLKFRKALPPPPAPTRRSSYSK